LTPVIVTKADNQRLSFPSFNVSDPTIIALVQELRSSNSTGGLSGQAVVAYKQFNPTAVFFTSVVYNAVGPCGSSAFYGFDFFGGFGFSALWETTTRLSEYPGVCKVGRDDGRPQWLRSSHAPLLSEFAGLKDWADGLRLGT
jgi:hypothetical protein